MFTFDKIILGGLQIMPSENYSADIKGLFDSENTNNTSNLITDGEKPGLIKRNAKTITINVYKLKDNFKALLQLNYILDQGEIDLEFKIDEFNDIFSCKILKESVAYDDFGNCSIICKICSSNIEKRDFKELILEMQYEGGYSLSPSGYSFPVEGYTFNEVVKGNEGVVINEGYKTVYPLIEIKGETNSITVSNLTTNEVFNLNTGLNTEEVIYIDCRKESRGVYKINSLGKKVDLLSCKNGVWISLINGENVLNVSYEGTAEIKIKWKESY